jgi:signal transduction histidine kinase/tetratricopeptide (TPR) repeat protein
MLPTLPYKLLPGRLCFALVCFALCCISACSTHKTADDPIIAEKLKEANNLILMNKSDDAVKVLDHVRPLISSDNPQLVNYYVLRVHQSFYHVDQANLYADSAIAFFKTASVKDHPNEYFKALLNKGDVCLHLGKYLTALNYFYEANKILSKCDCDNGELASKIAIIYYGQKNYLISAQYHAKSYGQLTRCNRNLTKDEYFYTEQGELDNAGIGFQKAGLLDSAYYYYHKDIAIINKADSEKTVHANLIHSARTVVCDNMGSWQLSQDNPDSAKYYLFRSLSEAAYCDEASSFPPMIKLANVYLKTNDPKDAEAVLNKCMYMVGKYKKSMPEACLSWYLTYSQLLSKTNRPADAYRYQGYYLKFKDTVNKSLSDLYRVDIEHEFSSIQQQQTLKEQNQQNLIRRIYLWSAILIAVLFSIIVAQIYRSLKKARYNNKLTTQQNEQLHHTLTELERVNKNYIRIMRVMAHDLRNPISGMTGLAAMLLEEEDIGEESKHMLRLIETTGLHTVEMISELLKTGLAEEDEKAVKQPLDIKALVYDSVELLQFKAADKEQKVIFESDNTPVIAGINHEKIWRVVNNLIVNAIKFSHIGGVIRVGMSSDDKNVLLSVADNGIGIPDDQKELIFEMFTPAKKPGTDGEQPFGLGLSISKRIVDMHNGRIWFESEAGKGTTFFVELPLK